MPFKVCVWIQLAVLVAGLSHAGPVTYIEKLHAVLPFASVLPAAQARGILLAGFEGGAETNTLLPGDFLTLLASWHDQGRWREQWLLAMLVMSNSTATFPESPVSQVLYTSTGERYEFVDQPRSIRIRVIGPFNDPSLSRRPGMLADKNVTVTVNETYLALGLDGAARVLQRLYGIPGPDRGGKRFDFGISDQAYSDAQITAGRTTAVRLNLTPAEQRSLTGGIPALFSYFETARQTPELESILFKILSLPSVWSLIHNFGITPGIAIGRPTDRLQPISLPDWGMPSGTSLYALPVAVVLNQHPALTLTMIVTRPRPPLLACGGIVGFLAENPDDPENYLTLRVIAARSGAGVAARRPQPVPIPGSQ